MACSDGVQSIVNKGFTERQARFLALVMRHSGVCLMRQYSTFAGIVFGQKTRVFFTKLVERNYASTYDCAHNRARIYHVRHRELYEAIGEPDSRLRRPPAIPTALERVMLIDAMLASPDIVWLATPDEKVAHLTTLARIPFEDLPHVTIGDGDARQVRHFPDRLPLGVHPEGRVVLVYLSFDPFRDDFRSFLQRHAAMVAGLPAWTIRIVLPVHRAIAAQDFEQTARNQLAGPLSQRVWDELRWYFEQLRAARSGAPGDIDEVRFRRDRHAFQAPRYPVLYRAWLQDGERVLTLASSSKIADALASGAGKIEPMILPHSYAHLSPLVGIA
jgi:hypothetical protein